MWPVFVLPDYWKYLRTEIFVMAVNNFAHKIVQWTSSLSCHNSDIIERCAIDSQSIVSQWRYN